MSATLYYIPRGKIAERDLYYLYNGQYYKVEDLNIIDQDDRDFRKIGRDPSIPVIEITSNILPLFTSEPMLAIKHNLTSKRKDWSILVMKDGQIYEIARNPESNYPGNDIIMIKISDLNNVECSNYLPSYGNELTDEQIQ